ncbi:MAG TPA: hypothetical protein PKD55_05790 [Bellilinea sp.]|nr:hypothetical protein [Bellilinea sp.]
MAKGEYYVKAAKNAGLHTHPGGNGSHTIIDAPRGQTPDIPRARPYMTVPHGELAKGTESFVRKWLLALGVPLAILLAILIF